LTCSERVNAQIVQKSVKIGEALYEIYTF
jgi:hypothetical protein